ncbi:MAG TPA: protein arginine kinase [Candidatus Brocadiia bacterium]|nr:protein arginine kinase [Candidatus Brocadiia bacterium]
MNVDDLKSSTGEWLKGVGNQSDIVISSRIRLARNVAGRRFVNRASDEERTELEVLLRDAIRDTGLLEDMLYLNLAKVEPIDRQFLVERHLISREHAGAEWQRGVALTRSERASLMVNEEDHLRIQMLSSGLEMEKLWASIDELDTALESRVDYAFSDKYGYLTACPTNVGTGMRVSVLMHLPALVVTDEIQRALRSLMATRFTVRGFYGEGTQAVGDLYQISNQATLGVREDELIGEISGVVMMIADYERRIREAIMERNRTAMEDCAWRSFGLLAHARTINSEEALKHLSKVRMGVNMGVISGLSVARLNEIFLWTLPAHMQKLEGRELDPERRDCVRARYIREQLAQPSKS